MQIRDVNEPFSNLAPVDIDLLLRIGVPENAIVDRRYVDLNILRTLGWTISDSSITPPSKNDDNDPSGSP